MKILESARRLVWRIVDIQDRLQKVQLALGRIEARQTLQNWQGDFQAAQFQVFSQWGEDGLIQLLTEKIEIKQKIFVEFGVQNYTESNSRFLLINQNWSGLVIDGSAENIKFIKDDPIYWRHNLKAECAFLDCENINQILENNGVTGEIGLLSVDIDGNDYWVWESISCISPAIVVVEYNSRFGPDRAVTVPYDPKFTRDSSHYSGIYYGASLTALNLLADKKGYAFVGANLAGNNAFFVRRDLLGDEIREMSVSEGFVEGKFREARDEMGALAFYDVLEEQRILDSLALVDVGADRVERQ